MLKKWLVSAPKGTARYWLTLAWVVARLAAGPLMRAKLFVAALTAPTRDRLIGPRATTVTLRYRDHELPWIVGPRSDFAVLNEVLVQDIYAFGLPADAPAVILDLGAHIGTSVLRFRAEYPAARIVAVEPDPSTFERLRHNVGGLPGVELRAEAVAAHDGTVAFHPAAQSWASRLDGDGHGVPVRARTLTSLLTTIPPADLLKLDIEGAERDVLDDRTLEGVGAIVGEYHDTAGRIERERFFELLGRHFDVTVDESCNFAGLRPYDTAT